MKGKVLSFAAGVVLAAGGLVGAYQTGLVGDDPAEEWCRGYIDGIAIVLSQFIGISPTDEELAEGDQSCVIDLANGAIPLDRVRGPSE